MKITIQPSPTADTRTCDWSKFEKEIEHFHSEFRTGFKETGWWDNHRKVNRHHLRETDGIPEDVNLIDVLDYIADCVMAGMARSGSVYEITLPGELLLRAFANTTELLKAAVVVEPLKDKGGEK